MKPVTLYTTSNREVARIMRKILLDCGFDLHVISNKEGSIFYVETTKPVTKEKLSKYQWYIAGAVDFLRLI